jgi:hypothetical protein
LVASPNLCEESKSTMSVYSPNLTTRLPGTSSSDIPAVKASNTYQVGGSHYVASYQHWDWASDVALTSYIYSASKYVMRFRKKNGEQDLQKAAHHLMKSAETALGPHNSLFYSGRNILVKSRVWDATNRFLHEAFPNRMLDQGEFLASGCISNMVAPYLDVTSPTELESVTYALRPKSFEEFAEQVSSSSLKAKLMVEELLDLEYLQPRRAETVGTEASPGYVNQDR